MEARFLKTVLALAFGCPTTLTAISAHASTLSNGNVLTISSDGSWWAIDYSNNGKIDTTEMVGLSQGSTGIVIGQVTSPGPNHFSAPTSGDTNAIDAPWAYFNDTGSDYVTVGITGSTTAGLDFSGWTMTWHAMPVIPWGSGAWQPAACPTTECVGHTFTNGNALFIWDGIYGDTYTIDYTATVPKGDPSGFGNAHYYLRLTGIVAVPEASMYAMMLAGLGMVGLRLRRK